MLQAADGAIDDGAFLPTAPGADALFRLWEHEAVADTTAGAGGENVGIGGAISINIVNVTTTAIVPTGASIQAGTGNSNLEAQSNNQEQSTASASAKGGKAGIGVALGLNVLNPTTTAEIENGAAFTGSATLTIKASTRQETTAGAKAGASSSGTVAVAPAVALTISNANTTARLGSGVPRFRPTMISPSPPVRSRSRRTTPRRPTPRPTPRPAARASPWERRSRSAVVTPTTTAEVARNLTGGSVAIHANSEVVATATTMAGASGAKNEGEDDGEEGKNNSDKQAQSQVDDNPNTKNSNTDLPTAKNGTGGSNGGGTDQASSTSSEQSGQGGSGVGVAASIVVNVVIETNQALVTGAITVTGTSGAVEIEATNHTDATGKAIGTALVDKANANVGVAVGVNVALVDNLATIATDATIIGRGVTLKAVTATDETNEFIVWGLAASGGTQSNVSVGGSIGVQVIVLNNIASTGSTSRSRRTPVASPLQPRPRSECRTWP